MDIAEQPISAERWEDRSRLQFLLDAARRFGSTLDSKRIYSALQELLAGAFSLDGLIVSSFDETTRMIYCEYIWSDGAELNASEFPPLQWTPASKGMQGQVIATGRAAIFDIGQKVHEAGTTYVEVAPDGGPKPVVEEPSARTAMMAPMLLEGEVTGVVQAMSDRSSAYSTEDLSVFEDIVMLMTAAWHHARLYQKMEAAETELERRVEKRTEELQEAVQELEGFTYTVSHDLRGPLRSISGASMMLREDFGELLPPEAHEHLKRQSEAAKKMGTLIDDLLKLSRLGRQELTPEPFDLTSLAHEVAAELEAHDRVAVADGLTAYGDARLLKFVLLNLLENALKFSPAGGEIKVGKEQDAFYVSDNGIGFEMQYASKLFLPFERLVRADEYPGTGIGLANVHRIVKRHGGKTWATSEIGRGSTFYFTLPN